MSLRRLHRDHLARAQRHQATAQRMARVHLVLVLVWLALLVPSLTWWRDSLAWVITMSLYANVAGHLSAWQAARGEAHQGE